MNWVHLLLVVPAVCLAADWSLELEYSLDSFASSFPLGRIELRRQFDGNYTGLFTSKADGQLATRLRKSLSSLYKVKATTTSGKKDIFIGFSKPCLILKSNLYHQFWVTVDSDRQLVHAVTVFPDVLAAGGAFESHDCVSDDFVSVSGAPQGTVHVANKGVLPTPDTQSFVNKMEKERKSRQHGAETDNRSFIAKYWMYIVPVVIFMLISNAVNPEGGAQE